MSSCRLLGQPQQQTLDPMQALRRSWTHLVKRVMSARMRSACSSFPRIHTWGGGLGVMNQTRQSLDTYPKTTALWQRETSQKTSSFTWKIGAPSLKISNSAHQACFTIFTSDHLITALNRFVRHERKATLKVSCPLSWKQILSVFRWKMCRNSMFRLVGEHLS